MHEHEGRRYQAAAQDAGRPGRLAPVSCSLCKKKMEKMKRLKKIAIIAVVVLLGIRLLVPVVNALVFHWSVPADLADAQWRGEWRSEVYPMISGKIVADLPDPIPAEGTFQVDAFVYYNLWSLFRRGGKLRTSLTGAVAPGQSMGTNVGSDTDLHAPIQITFQFKGGPGPGSQVIDYVATADTYWTIIAGGYTSVRPADMGVFTLKKE